MKLKKYAIVALFTILIASNYFAQNRDDAVRWGLQFNGLYPMSEFNIGDIENYSLEGRTFFRFGLSNAIGLELGAGFGNYRGVDLSDNYYNTEIIPVDLRLLYYPYYETELNPYFYIGGGVLNYQVQTKPKSISPNSVEANGWTGLIPVGFGIQIPISEVAKFDISAGYNYTFTDNLNLYSGAKPTDGYFNLGIGLTFDISCSNDNDEDGLTNDQEKELGTDPNNSDTDGDGLMDGLEVTKYMTNPLKADTDGDNLSDKDEIMNYKTSPVKADTDNDGLTDGEEINVTKTDPLNADSDGDKLSDGDEVNKYKTDPNKKDTDSDTLSDYDEVITFKTNPLKADTDNDKLSDGDEVNKYKTDPNKMDSDDGSVDDFTEINRGTNPLDKSDDIYKVEEPIVLEGITFETGSAVITKDSEKTLNEVLSILKKYSDLKIEIRGYTDNSGSLKLNTALSQKRADAVKYWLNTKGIMNERMEAKGFGPENPIASNSTKEGKAKNRRIEFVTK